MKKLIVGDIHHKLNRLDLAIKDWKDGIIFLGDYFDDFDDTLEDVTKTAEWLKDSLTKENRIHLIGNHDFQYMVRPKGITYCSGFTSQKYDRINEILNQDDWDKLKFFHNETEKHWFSHAGITKYWFEHPVLGMNLESIYSIIDSCTKAMKASNIMDCGALWAADRYRGGRYEKGGLLWNDWRNCDYFKGITQIFGHTPVEEIKCAKRKGGVNINIDTHLSQVLELDFANDKWEIKDIC